MTISILDAPELTDDQQTALDLVQTRPGLTVEDYARLPNLECDEKLYNAIMWLNYNRYVEIDLVTQAVTVKG